jgi:4-amino-4-deoxy-L-arabinose transferase-like glycosyltransferase
VSLRPRPLPVILVLSLAAKLLIWHGVASGEPMRFLGPDSGSYLASARALVETGSFAVSPEHPDVPQTMRTPGYPLFLAAAYRMFGGEAEAAVALQILLSLATIALTWRLGAALWDEKTANRAAALLALDVVSFSHALLLLSDTLFALCLLCAALAAIRVAGGAPGRSGPLALGAALAAATLVRPLGYYLIVPLLAALLAWGRMGLLWPRWRIVTTAAWTVLPFALVVGGWQVRNQVRAGDPGFSQIDGVNALFYRAAGILALRDGITLEAARQGLAPEGYVAFVTRAMLHPGERLADRGTAEYLRLLAAHPLLALRSAGGGALRMMAGTGEDALTRLLGLPGEGGGPLGDLRRLTRGEYVEKWLGRFKARFWLFLLALAHLLLLGAGVALWVVTGSRPRRAGPPGTPGHEMARRVRGAHAVLWTILLYIVAISAGPEANEFFRLPIVPFLCLYAAAGIGAALAHRPRRAPEGTTGLVQEIREAPGSRSEVGQTRTALPPGGESPTDPRWAPLSRTRAR